MLAVEFLQAVLEHWPVHLSQDVLSNLNDK